MQIKHTNSRKAVKDRLSATFFLDEEVTKIAQVSADRARLLANRGITSVRDVLNTYPRRYQDMSKVVNIGPARIGEECTIVGELYEIQAKRPRPKLHIFELTLVDETGTLIVTIFNQPWLGKTLKPGMVLSVAGKVEFNYGFKRMTSPVLEVLDSAEDAQGKVITFYPGSAKLSRAVFKRIVANALKNITGLYDPLPIYLRTKYRLCSRYSAYRAIHEPQSMDDVVVARRRLIYEELFFLQLALLNQQKQKNQIYQGYVQSLPEAKIQELKANLPFALTGDQQNAIDEILSKMGRPEILNHLLLGDVGSGKTVVSLFGLVAACENGHQAAMLGPTEILVRQYATSLGTYLTQLGISWAILTGSTSASEKVEIINKVTTGDIQVLFGTHAILEKSVVFNDCSFLCIDEQQRFGVDQRKAFFDKAPKADILSMTATPIPRSLALALYGDLTLSYIKSAPATRGCRTTRVCHFSEQALAYDAVIDAVERGEQAYIVCPLIGISTDDLNKLASDNDDSDQQDQEIIEYAAIEWGLASESLQPEVMAASKHAEILQETVFSQYRVGLLHGKLSQDEKQSVMEDFRNGEIDILVSTTVVEVGVDVPNATVMIVEDADRFGLAQLHQLRGRVGRGEKDASVFLVSRSKSQDALERLAIMERTDDGFQLSEYDLSLRKEGDIFGLDQHGASKLKLVNVVRDSAVIEAARQDAMDVLYNQSVSDEEFKILEYELSMFLREMK